MRAGDAAGNTEPALLSATQEDPLPHASDSHDEHHDREKT